MPPYDRNHVVSVGYLKRWTSTATGDLVAVGVNGGDSGAMRPKVAGWRPRFWAQSREAREWVETRLSRVEHLGTTALLDLIVDWPGTQDQQLALAELIGLHLVRNPAGRARFEAAQVPLIQQRLANDDGWDEKSKQQFARLATDDSAWVDSFMSFANRATSLVASTHWTLVEFPAPLLATSDQPVTTMPLLAPGEQVALTALPRGALIDSEELRFPLSPRHLLLMTWLNEPGFGRVRADEQIAALANRTTIGQADRQWFHHPARKPTTLLASDLSDRGCRPIGAMFVPGYGWQVARDSPRRAHTRHSIEYAIEHQESTIRVTRTVAA